MNGPRPAFISFPGKIHLITADAQLAEISSRLEGVSELGFDTETRPSFRKGEVHKVALLQLATPEDAYLIRLHRIQNFGLFRDIFENPRITKIGLAIRDDLKSLRGVFEFKHQNFVELQELAKQKGLQNFGLKGMTEEVLNAALSKKAKITNWEASELTDAQLLYAATDAWIGLELYRRLIGLK